MDTVIEWLNKDVILSEKIENIPEQFANGYHFGELLHRYNQLLEFPEGFKNQNYKNATVENFTRIEACLRNLSVRFTVYMAQEIIQKNLDTTFLLLRALKNTLEKTQGMVDVNVLKKTGAKNITFPVNKYNFSKDRFATIQNEIFHKRLSNILKPQNEVALETRLEKFSEFQTIEEERLRKFKMQEQESKERDFSFNREQLITQLKRTMNFGKQWEADCKVQWETNLAIGKERVKHKENFVLKLKNKQTQVHVKIRKENEETVRSELNNFEEKHLQKKAKPVLDVPMNTLEEKLGYRENNINLLTGFIYNLVSHTAAMKIKEKMKVRENVLNSELSKKERDRRLRKMLVDVRKYQSFKDLNNKKRTLLDKVMINSVQENKLYAEFEKVANYREVFEYNKKLRDRFYNRKREEIIQRNIELKNGETGQREQESMNFLHEFKTKMTELEKKTELMRYKQKYDMSRKDLAIVLDSSFDVGTLFALFNIYKIPDVIKPIFNFNIRNLQPLSLNKEFNTEIMNANGTLFMKLYFGQNYFTPDQQTITDQSFIKFFANVFGKLNPKSIRPSRGHNHMYLPLKIAMVGLPYSNHVYMANYIKELFNLVSIDTKSLVQGIMDQLTEGSLDDEEKSRILSYLKKGEILKDFSTLFTKAVEASFEGFENEIDYLKSLSIIQHQEEMVAIKIADAIKIPGTIDTQLINLKEPLTKDETNKENKISNVHESGWELKSTVKINEKGLALSKTYSNKSLKEEDLPHTEIDEKESVEGKDAHDNCLISKVAGDNLSVKGDQPENNVENASIVSKNVFIKNLKPSGVLFIDYPHSVDECLKLEKHLSNYTPEDQLPVSENDKFTKLVKEIYSEDFIEKQETQENEIFFDLIIEVVCNKDQIFERAFHDKKIEHPEDILPALCNQIVDKRESMKVMAGFYKQCKKPAIANTQNTTLSPMGDNNMRLSSDLRDNLTLNNSIKRVYTIDSSEPEYQTIPKIESIIKKLFESKIQHFKSLWAQHEFENANLDKEKKQLAAKIEEANVNSLIPDNELRNRVELLVNEFDVKSLMKNLFPKAIEIFQLFVTEYNRSLARFYRQLSAFFSSYLLDQTKLVNGCMTLFAVEGKFNCNIQEYVHEYNNFIYAYKRLLNTEEVKNELHCRVSDLSSTLSKDLSNTLKKMQTYIKSFFESKKHKACLDTLAGYFIGLLMTELQKLIMEHYFLSYHEYFEANYFIKDGETDDKKTKKPAFEDRSLPPIDVPIVCKVEAVIEKMGGMAETKGKEDPKTKVKKEAVKKENDTVDMFESMLEQVELVFNTVISSVEANQFDELVEKTATNDVVKGNPKDKQKATKVNAPEEIQPVKNSEMTIILNTEFLRKARLIKEKLVGSISFLKANKQRISDEMSKTSNSILHRYGEVSEQLIFHLVSHIEKNEFVKNYIYVKDGQLIQDVKTKYKVMKQIDIPQIIELEGKERFSCNTIYEIYKFVTSIKNAFSLCDKIRILDFLLLNCSKKYAGTVMFPQKWRSLKLENLEAICDNLESTTDHNYISCSFLLIAIIFEEYKVPSAQLIEFYSQFSDISQFMTKEDFLDVR